MAATLRGRFVEAEQPAGAEETTGFCLENVTFVEQAPEGPSDLRTTAINLDMPSAETAENWVGKEVKIEGYFKAPPEEGASRQVFVVEHIGEA